MNQVMQGKPCTIFGDGLQTRAFSHISDIAPIIARSIENPEAYNETFNIGADKAYSVNELAEVVQKHMDKRTGIIHVEARDEVLHAFSDHSRARRVLGCSAQVDLNEGVRRMAQWAKSVGSKKSKNFEHIEVPRHLPSIWRSIVNSGQI
jgi:UDP-glucose 4-epimerase